MCSLIGDDNIIEENVEVPYQVLGKAIHNFWADGERNVMVMCHRQIKMGCVGLLCIFMNDGAQMAVKIVCVYQCVARDVICLPKEKKNVPVITKET